LGRNEEVAVQFFVRSAAVLDGDYVGTASFRNRREEIMNAIEQNVSDEFAEKQSVRRGR
jgi:hypothetical protein